MIISIVDFATNHYCCSVYKMSEKGEKSYYQLSCLFIAQKHSVYWHVRVKKKITLTFQKLESEKFDLSFLYLKALYYHNNQ